MDKPITPSMAWSIKRYRFEFFLIRNQKPEIKRLGWDESFIDWICFFTVILLMQQAIGLKLSNDE